MLNSMLIEGIIKIEAEINETENKKPIEKNHKTKCWIFGKFNKIDKLPSQPDELKKKNREKNKLPVSRVKGRASPQILQICQ